MQNSLKQYRRGRALESCTADAIDSCGTPPAGQAANPESALTCWPAALLPVAAWAASASARMVSRCQMAVAATSTLLCSVVVAGGDWSGIRTGGGDWDTTE